MMGGSQARYLDLLEIFRRDAMARLPLLKISATPDEAERKSLNGQVHALKSALANIGAHALAATAAKLEGARRASDLPMLHEHLGPFRDGLEALMEHIGIALEACAQDGKKASSPDEDERAREMLSELAKALETDDIDAMDATLEALQALALSPAMREVVTTLSDCVLMADFARAEEIIKTIESGASPDRLAVVPT
jgi:HPt (histidine-containing phosphotransfer) domain-containing protein